MIRAAFRKAWLKENNIKEFDDIQHSDVSQENQSPIIRVHPSEKISPPRSPASSMKWSPAITRTKKDEEIPFELPPLSPGRLHSGATQTNSLSGNSTVDNTRTRSLSFTHYNSLPRTGNSREKNVKTHQRMFSVDSSDFYQQNLSIPENNGLGKIEPELYKTTPTSCRSQYGRVWFSLVYDGAIELLTVKILKIKQLPPRSTGHNPPRDSFVKLFLLPDEKHSHQTKVRHRCNHPVFNESFSFRIPNSEIHTRVLRLSVYDDDKQKSSRCLIGHALINLGEVEFSKANEEMWRDLDDIAKPGDNGSSMGELNISLSYIPSVERLNVVVKEAKNLRKFDLDAAGIYVRVDLNHGNNTTKTKKTCSKMGMSEVEFNEIFHYNISSGDMEQTSLTFTVITRRRFGSLYKFKSSFKHAVSRGRYGVENKYGEVRIGSHHSTGEQSLHWQEVLSQAPKSIVKWHSLSDAVDNNL